MRLTLSMKWLASLAFLTCLGTMANAQNQGPMTPEEQEKKTQEYINKEIERLESSLKLEDWQVFYVDSILNNDIRAMQAEMKNLQDSKVSNMDIYSQVSDKWVESTYVAFRKVLNDDQWNKYLKSGAAREKKARDKRKAKKEESSK